MGRRAGLAGAGRACLRHARLPFQRPRRAPPKPGRDGRPLAPDGGDPQQRAMQSRPPDLCVARAQRHREAVRPPLIASIIGPGSAWFEFGFGAFPTFATPVTTVSVAPKALVRYA